MDKKIDKNNLAVLVVDMQQGFFKKPYETDLEPSKEELILSQKEVIKECIEKKIPLIYIECRGMGKTIEPLRRLLKNAKAKKIKKNYACGFSQPHLKKHLKKIGRNQLYFSGILSDACVYSTALGALALDDPEIEIISSSKDVISTTKFANFHEKEKAQNLFTFDERGIFTETYQEIFSKL